MTKKINYIRKNKTQIRKVRRRKRKSMFSDLNKKMHLEKILTLMQN